MSSAPDDTLLHAWLDGELLPERRAEIEAWLQAHPDDAARVRLWTADRDALRARFDTVLGEPAPQALAQVVWRKAPHRLAPPAVAWGRWAAGFAVRARRRGRCRPDVAAATAGGRPVRARR